MAPKYTEEELALQTERLLESANPPGTRPRQVMFGLYETAQILGVSAGYVRRVLDRYDAKISHVGPKRKLVEAREIAKVQLGMLADEKEVAA